MICKVSLAFARLSDSELDDFAHGVFNALTGVTRGKEYTEQIRALGGSTGQSDWSDPSTHMAM